MSFPILSTAMLAALVVALYAAIKEFRAEEPRGDTVDVKATTDR